MAKDKYIQRPYIGDFDIDWNEERNRNEELRMERWEDVSWEIDQDMLESDNRCFEEMIDDYEAWGNID